jgi:hypothetical protein
VSYTVRQLSFGDVQENNVPGIYDGPFPWEDTFGFHPAGMVGHDFFKRYAVIFDFQKMQIFPQLKFDPKREASRWHTSGFISRAWPYVR